MSPDEDTRNETAVRLAAPRASMRTDVDPVLATAVPILTHVRLRALGEPGTGRPAAIVRRERRGTATSAPLSAFTSSI
jgi:hypothetical protein